MTIRDYINQNHLEAEYDFDCATPYMTSVANALGIDAEDPVAHSLAALVAVAVHRGRTSDAAVAEMAAVANDRDWEARDFLAEMFSRYGLEYAI